MPAIGNSLAGAALKPLVVASLRYLPNALRFISQIPADWSSAMLPSRNVMFDTCRNISRQHLLAHPLAAAVVILGLSIGLTACTNPYDPGQRALGGAALGAGTGAAIGAVAGGGHGAAIGALAGGAIGAVGGVATTPPSPYYGGGYYQQPGYYQQQGYYQQPRYYAQPGYYPQPGYYQQPGYYGQPGYYQRWPGSGY